VGFTTSENPLSESIIKRAYIDGTFDFISYGARKGRIAEFTIMHLTKANSITLTNYFLSNVGNKVLFTIENDGEEIFPEYPFASYPSLYVYILESSNLQTEDFSMNDSLYTMTVKVALAGTSSGAIPNAAGTSTLDGLIKIDTALADYVQSGAPVAVEGARWLDTDDYKLYECRSLTWKYLFTVPADDTDYGLVYGVFYLSCFSNTVYSGKTYKAGLTNKDSLRLPNKNIDFSNGPSIARREGFSFSIPNNGRFWKYIIDNAVNLYGAKVEAGVISSGTYQKIGSGKIKTIDFGYTDYKIDVEPYSLNSDDSFPAEELSADDSRYADTKEEFLGKPIFVTYGEHETAALQNISTIESFVKPVRYPPVIAEFPVEEVESIACHVCYDYLTKIFIRKGTHAVENYYEFTTEQIALINSGVCVLNVLDDSHAASTNVKKVRKINSISSINTIGSSFISIAVDYITYIGSIVYIFVPDTVDLSAPENIIGGMLTITGATNLGNNGTFAIVGYSNSIGFKYISVSNGSGMAENPSPAVCTVYVSYYYVLTLEDALPDNPTYNSNIVWPSTDDILHIAILENIYKFQIDEEVCGGFGTLEPAIDAWTADVLDIRKFDDTQHELEPLMGVGFTTNADDNLLTLDPAMTNQDSEVPQYVKVDSVLMKGHLVNYPAMDTSTWTYDFSGLNVPASPPWSGYWMSRDGGSTGPRVPNLYSIYDGVDTGAANWGSVTTNDSNGNNYSTSMKLYCLADSSAYPDVIDEKSCIIAFKIPIKHLVDKDALLTGQTNVRLAMKLSISSYQELRGGITGEKIRYCAAACQVGVRFRRFDGTFIYDTDWLHEFDADELGVSFSGNDNLGNVEINNKPDVSALAFGDNTVLTSNYSHVFVGSGTSAPIDSVTLAGDKYWNTTSGKLFTHNGSSWGSGEILANGTLLYQVYYTSGVLVGAMFKVQAGTPQTLVAAVDGVDYTSAPVQRGKDLFDISAAFAAGVWAEVESLELFIMNGDLSTPHSEVGFASFSTFKVGQLRWLTNIVLDSYSPTIYMANTIEIKDTPLFVGCRGRKIDGAYSSYASQITKAVLDEIYSGKYNATSLTTLFSGERNAWKFRRQFTSAMKVEEVLEELLKNLWACAYFNNADELVLASLKDESLYSATADFTDAKIIVDSISQIKFRQSSEVYQDFVLEYDYNIPSEFSDALPEFKKNVKANKDAGDIGLKALLAKSNNLYNLENKYRDSFKYHYKNLPIDRWIVEFFALNMWSFKYKTKLENAIGANYLDIMSRVKFKSWFHTNNVYIYGLVDSISVDLYNGLAEIGLFIPAPLGQFGPVSDPFNDALNLETRDITGWTNANGRRNDAGRLDTRVIGSYTQKDAGALATRTFD
jgi:hypothetical protein